MEVGEGGPWSGVRGFAPAALGFGAVLLASKLGGMWRKDQATYCRKHSQVISRVMTKIISFKVLKLFVELT